MPQWPTCIDLPRSCTQIATSFYLTNRAGSVSTCCCKSWQRRRILRMQAPWSQETVVSWGWSGNWILTASRKELSRCSSMSGHGGQQTAWDSVWVINCQQSHFGSVFFSQFQKAFLLSDPASSALQPPPPRPLPCSTFHSCILNYSSLHSYFK